MSLRHTYFSASGFNPIPWLERLANPHSHETEVPLRDHPLRVRWTERAEQALQKRSAPLNVEMQLYFSCVVKKRVLFPERARKGTKVPDGRIRLVFRTVESDACDPESFAAGYPERRDLSSAQARKMHARELWLDFRRGRWEGEMII